MPLVITFLTDFGVADDFVGTCHGVMKRIAPEVEIIDITHGIAPQEVLQGALVLRNTLPYMPEGVHLAVVDPGVGTDRKAIACEAATAGSTSAPTTACSSPRPSGWAASPTHGSSTEPRVPAVAALAHVPRARRLRTRGCVSRRRPGAGRARASSPIARARPARRPRAAGLGRRRSSLTCSSSTASATSSSTSWRATSTRWASCRARGSSSRSGSSATTPSLRGRSPTSPGATSFSTRTRTGTSRSPSTSATRHP